MTQISQRRQQILIFIREFIGRKGYPPTIRDILRACNISSIAVVQHHLKVLENQGYISRDPGIRRSITLTDSVGHAERVPILGYIAAGQPIPVPQWAPRAKYPTEVLVSLSQYLSRILGTRSPWRRWTSRLTWLPTRATSMP